ncbi:KinB-signaling pathway activation protein [Paenibacillus silviterrae]|uniref:KinB-signaling pathway activation protein n=1 Tax=Paenibacillus silviterrae TaxID=3242194 RepID=UPI002543113A|nr:KinB-signaling pathway activation protein [Paenibacillus chinjuensis]
MTLRKWFYLFWTTLVIGSIAALAAGLLLQATDQSMTLAGKEIGFNIINMLLAGATISVLSQMGFFAYLIVRFIMMGMIRNKLTWDLIQLILVGIVLVDLVYFRYSGSTGQEGWAIFLVLPVTLVVLSWIVAARKVKITNKSAWIPTFFFLVFVTALEALPSIRLNNAASTFFMLVPLYLCNVWQILILTKIVETKKEPA